MRKEIIGNAIVYLADAADVMDCIPDCAALITDPPYGLGNKLSGGSWGATANHKNVLEWDAAAPHALLSVAMKKAAMSVVWGGNYFQLPISRGWLVWNKPNAVPSAADAELAWTSLDANIKRITLPVTPHSSGHPTEKPLQLMRWTIRQVGFPETIFDPFMGSGTTGVAALELGLKFIGIERDATYFEIACKRLQAAHQQPALFHTAPQTQTQTSFRL